MYQERLQDFGSGEGKKGIFNKNYSTITFEKCFMNLYKITKIKKFPNIFQKQFKKIYNLVLTLRKLF